MLAVGAIDSTRLSTVNVPSVDVTQDLGIFGNAANPGRPGDDDFARLTTSGYVRSVNVSASPVCRAHTGHTAVPASWSEGVPKRQATSSSRR